MQLIDVHTYYGDSYILQGVSLEVKEGQVAVLLGRNGVGKTTTIKSVIGFVTPRRGTVVFKDINITAMPAYKIARLGMCIVPQGRRIFPSLSVEENLLIAYRHTRDYKRWNLATIYKLFPILRERAKVKGTKLSGGEQQMLAIGRALMSNTELVVMDEPSEGLAPKIVEDIGSVIQQIKEAGLSIFLVEQNLSLAVKVADYIYIMSKGKIVHECLPGELSKDQEVQKRYLGV